MTLDVTVRPAIRRAHASLCSRLAQRLRASRPSPPPAPILRGLMAANALLDLRTRLAFPSRSGMKLAHRALRVAAALALVGCGTHMAVAPREPARSQDSTEGSAGFGITGEELCGEPEKIFGERGRWILAAPERVEAFRVRAQDNEAKEAAISDLGPAERASLPGVRVAGYPVLAKASWLPQPLSSEIVSRVANECTYDQSGAPGCAFEPGVAFRVVRGSESLDAVVCFACNQIEIVISREGRPVHVNRLAQISFDRGRRHLLDVARAAFPSDTQLSGLK